MFFELGMEKRKKWAGEAAGHFIGDKALDNFAAGDVASGRGGAAAGSVACGFEEAVAADAATDRDLKQRQAGEAAAVILIRDLFHDGWRQAFDRLLLSGILGSLRNLTGN